MKSTIDELLALQDDPLFDPERRRALESDPEIAARLRLLRSRRVALKEMPGLQVSADSWQRIVAAEQDTGQWISRRFAGGLATAACAALVAILAINISFTPDGPRWSAGETSTKSQPVESVSAQADLDMLQQKSRQLEQALRRMPRSPVVRRVDTAGPIVNLQDRIAVVDYQLNQADAAGLSGTNAAALWQQRIDLMNRLLRARYVESEYYAF